MSVTGNARRSNINNGAKEILSQQLATLEIAILKLQDAIDSTIAVVDPANVTWRDVNRLSGIVQMLRSANLVSDVDPNCGG